MKKIVSILLLLTLIVGIAASATLSSNASNTAENLDYSRFEIEYLMNTLEHNGSTLNGSVDVYNQVMTENFFHRGIHDYFIKNSLDRGLTAAAAQVFNSDLNLIEHPEYFYTVVLLDILQSSELDVFNSDSIKSSMISNTEKVFEKSITQLADEFTGNSNFESISVFKKMDVSQLTEDQLDIDLLNEAGALLANVDQSKTTEVLLETSAEYVEYLSLIDQLPEIEIEDEETEGIYETDTGVEPEGTITEQDEKIDIFEMIMNIIRSIFEMFFAYIPVSEN